MKKEEKVGEVRSDTWTRSWRFSSSNKWLFSLASLVASSWELAPLAKCSPLNRALEMEKSRDAFANFSCPAISCKSRRAFFHCLCVCCNKIQSLVVRVQAPLSSWSSFNGRLGRRRGSRCRELWMDTTIEWRKWRNERTLATRFMCDHKRGNNKWLLLLFCRFVAVANSPHQNDDDDDDYDDDDETKKNDDDQQ